MTIKTKYSITLTLFITVLFTCLSPNLSLFSEASDVSSFQTIHHEPSSLVLNESITLLAEDFSFEWSERGEYSTKVPFNYSLTPSLYLLNLHWASFGSNTDDPGYKLDFISGNESLGITTLRKEMIDDLLHVHPFYLNLTSETVDFNLLITWNNPMYIREGELVLYSESTWNKINSSGFSLNDSIILPNELSVTTSSDTFSMYSYASALALILFEQPYCSFTLTFNLDLSYAYSFNWLKMDIYHANFLFHSQTIEEEGSNEVSFQLDFPSSFLIFRIELKIYGQGDFVINLDEFYTSKIVEPETEENEDSIITSPFVSDGSSFGLPGITPSPTGSKFRQFLESFNYSFQAFILHSGFFAFLFISIHLLKFLGYKKYDPDAIDNASKGFFDDYLSKPITDETVIVKPLDGPQRVNIAVSPTSKLSKSIFPVPINLSKPTTSSFFNYIFLLVYLTTFSLLLFYKFSIAISLLSALISSFAVFIIVRSICHKSETIIFSMNEYFDELKGIISNSESNNYTSYSPVYSHPISTDGTYKIISEIFNDEAFLMIIYEFDVNQINQQKLGLWDKKEALELLGYFLSVFQFTSSHVNSSKISFKLQAEVCLKEEEGEAYSDLEEIADILIPFLYPVVSAIVSILLITNQEEKNSIQAKVTETSDSTDQIRQSDIFTKSLFNHGTKSQTVTFDEIMEGGQ